MLVGAAVVGAGGCVVRGRVAGGAVVWGVVTKVDVDSTTVLVDVDEDEVVLGTVVVGGRVDGAVVDGAVVDGDVSEVTIESVTEIRSTVGSAESSWNAAITARLATMTAANAPMNPLFLGTYPANRSGTSKSFRLPV